jgi:sulfur relay (sulfurtransferase) complex TusBCD TusD component (DsrE family)
MKVLFIINDPPYGTERCYNALRLAGALLKSATESRITVFLMADARRSTIDELAATTIAADKLLVF